MSAFLPVLAARLSAAAAAAFGTSYAAVDPELRGATKPEFGHFQTSVALKLAKSLGLPPRVIAERLVAAAELADLCEPAVVAGPGFVNLTLLPSVLAEAVNSLPGP